jgi:hypothetical protein
MIQEDCELMWLCEAVRRRSERCLATTGAVIGRATKGQRVVTLMLSL